MAQEQVSDRLLLVGTAHVSPASVAEVEAAVASFKPDVVAVELDPLRLDALEDRQKWESTPIHKLLKSDKLWLFLVQILLASYQRRLGDVYGAQPGAEMLAAVKAARAGGHEVLLADRDVGVTMKRAFRGMRFREKARLSWEVFKGVVGAEEEEVAPVQENPEAASTARERAAFSRTTAGKLFPVAVTLAAVGGILLWRGRPDYLWWPAVVAGLLLVGASILFLLLAHFYEASPTRERPAPAAAPKADLDALLQEDALTATMKELGAYAPSIKRVVLDERDEYLAARIHEPLRAGKRVLGVVGAGHLAGIRERLRSGDVPRDLAPLEVVPKKKTGVGTLLLQWFLPLSVLGILAYFAFEGIREGNWQKLRDAALYWTLFTGSFAALGTLLARGHPLAILTAFVAAPITTLHPTLAAGWFAGIVEAWVRTPTVLDFQAISRVKTMKDLLGNRVIRILMVAALANLGAIAGSALGTYKVVRIFGG